MDVATAASAYGPEYYRTFSSEPEDDNVKLRRTLATQKSIAIPRKQWTSCVLSSIVIALS